MKEEEIEAYIVKMLKDNPMRIVKYCLLEIARDLHRANIDEFTLSQECDVEEDKRVEVKLQGTIKKIN